MRPFIIILGCFGTMIAVSAFGERVQAAEAGAASYAARRTMSVTTRSKSLSEAQVSARSHAEP